MHDLNKVALVVSVVALFLTMPLSVLANLLTPRLRDWWSNSSQARVRERIKDIEDILQNPEASWDFTPAGWFTHWSVGNGVMTILICIQLLFFFLVTLLLFSYEAFVTRIPISHPRTVYWLLLFAANLGFFVCFVFQRMTRRSLDEDRGLHTKSGKEDLREELERLKSRLN